ncbi:MAG: hypothetical protein MR428_04015 [Mesosutterella sp.]|nr:hypothetical protein [Mesosutterella sp.]
MSLKDHLEHLVMRLGSTASAPQTATGIDLSVTPGKSLLYTAPTDGFIVVSVNSNNSGSLVFAVGSQLSLTNGFVLVQNAISIPGNGWGTHSIFVQKGQVVKIDTIDSMAVNWAHFIPTVGGGIKGFIFKALRAVRCAGGELCRLKTISLPSSTAITRLINRFRSQHTSRYQGLAGAQIRVPDRTPHRQTDFSYSTFRRTPSMSSELPVRTGLSLRGLGIGRAASYLCERGKQQLSETLQRTRSTTGFAFTRWSEHSLVAGGAI